jgi:gamma-glutamyltranspeptidase/glutathione hydrolase
MRKTANGFFTLLLLCLPAVLLGNEPAQGLKPMAEGQTAMVATAHPRATEAALEILKAGGNAMDAGLAAMVLLTVIEPEMATLAGGGGLIYFDAAKAETRYLNFEPDMVREPDGRYDPGNESDKRSGRSILVPGSVAGLKLASERCGKLPWAKLFDPAIRAAEEGFAQYPFLYYQMLERYPVLARLPEPRGIFLSGGFVPSPGSVIRQKALGATLRRLAAEGSEYFYRGEWGRRFVEAVRALGGAITREDMAGYRARLLQPLEIPYRGMVFKGSPPPDTGGFVIGQMLRLLEEVDLKAMGHFSDSAETLHLMANAMALSLDEARRFIKDPEYHAIPLETLLSKEHARERLALLRASGPRPARTSSSGEINTTHLSLVDKDGNALALTHTVYGDPFSTSGLFVDGVCVNSARQLAYGWHLEHGHRMASPVTPALVFREGTPVLAAGSPGQAIQATFFTTVNVLDYGMGLDQALAAPRFTVSRSGIEVESRIPDQVVGGLRERGNHVEWVGDFNWHFGGVHAVLIDRQAGKLYGAADPRRTGQAKGY